MSAVVHKHPKAFDLPNNERRSQPLRNATRLSLQLYFKQLGGHQPDNLYRMVVDEVEVPLLECVMNYCKGNQSLAAQYLGLNRGTLRKKLKTHGLI